MCDCVVYFQLCKTKMIGAKRNTSTQFCIYYIYYLAILHRRGPAMVQVNAE